MTKGKWSKAKANTATLRSVSVDRREFPSNSERLRAELAQRRFLAGVGAHALPYTRYQARHLGYMQGRKIIEASAKNGSQTVWVENGQVVQIEPIGE